MKLEVGKTYKLVNDKDGIAKVLAEVSGEYSPKRYWVEISYYRNAHAKFVVECFGNGINVSGHTAYDLMEIPPEPRKVSRWLHMFSDSSGVATMGFSNNKEITTYGSVKLIGRKKITLTEGEFDE